MTATSVEVSERIEQLAQDWAAANSMRSLRGTQRRRFKREIGEAYGLTKSVAWKAVKRAIAIKLEGQA